MVLDGLRKEMERALGPLTALLSPLPPDLFTVLSLALAVLAGALYWTSGEWVPGGRYPWLLLAAVVLVALSAIADSLDGSIARRTGRTSAAGDFLDHSFDRLSDIAILSGIALSPYCNVLFGLTAVIFVLLSSYMGTQAQAVGCSRNYTGVMGRADRMVSLLLATPFQFIVTAVTGSTGVDIGLGLKVIPMEVLMGIMLVGGILTTLSRGMDTLRELKRKDMASRKGRSRAFEGAGLWERPRRRKKEGGPDVSMGKQGVYKGRFR